MDNDLKRYQRNQRSISTDDQERLARAKAAVIGCGGLGGYVAEELARLGVGRLVLFDGDQLELTNLNRQILATEKNLGQWKVEAAQERLQAVNSTIEVEGIRDWFQEESGATQLQGVDLVFDALDSIPARLALERICHSLDIPLVFAGIAGWFGLLGVSFPGDFSVRKLLGRQAQQTRGVEASWGNPAFTPAVVASLAVAEGIKVLTGREVSLKRSWLHVDLLDMEFERFELI